MEVEEWKDEVAEGAEYSQEEWDKIMRKAW